MNLTHIDDNNRPKMVDVSGKNETHRIAVASGKITMSREAYDAIIGNVVKKGPVLQTAVIAAIMGTKKTSELIPMCHPLLLSGINCDIEELPQTNSFKLFVTAKLNGQTGVEMEALTAASVAALTVYDMCKAVDMNMEIQNVYLEQKCGGKHGHWKKEKRDD